MKKISTKDYVLKELELNKGKYITGTALSKVLGLSRNSIWKAINELREQGYNIISVTNKGYMLESDSDIISVQAISNYLNDLKNTLINNQTENNDLIDQIINDIIIYDKLASTNQTAKTLLITGETDKNIIIAKTQTHGLGHDNSSFDSPAGGIYMSIILKPEYLKCDGLKSKTIGEIVKKSIVTSEKERIVLDSQLNRIYINNIKAAGIMTEYFADLETGKINGYVIGIGITYPDIKKNQTIANILFSLYMLLY